MLLQIMYQLFLLMAVIFWVLLCGSLAEIVSVVASKEKDDLVADFLTTLIQKELELEYPSTGVTKQAYFNMCERPAITSFLQYTGLQPNQLYDIVDVVFSDHEVVDLSHVVEIIMQFCSSSTQRKLNALQKGLLQKQRASKECHTSNEPKQCHASIDDLIKRQE